MSVNIVKISYNAFKRAASTLFVYYYNYNNEDGYAASCGNNDFVYITSIKSPSDIVDFANTFIDGAELVVWEKDLIALPGIDLRLSTTRFDIQGDVIYIGKAAYGSLESEPKWTIRKIILVSGVPTQELITNQQIAVWTNRNTETYQ